MDSMADLIFTDQNFKSQVLDNQIPVIVDFWAPWCHPCKIIDPLIDELAKEYAGRVVVGKINTDEHPQIAEQLNVMSMPTVMVFKGGQPVKALVGAQGRQTYKQSIEEVLAS
jgi:thioredoxin 1